MTLAATLKSYGLVTNGGFAFDTISIQLPGPTEARAALLRAKDAGYNLCEAGGGVVQVACDETTTLDHLRDVVAALVGAVAAWAMYGKSAERGTSSGLHKLLYNKYYVDELYDALIIAPLVWLSRNILWKVVDVGVIDGTVNGIAHGANAIGDASRHTQSGNARSYAVWILIGALVIFVIIFWPLFGPAGGVR